MITQFFKKLFLEEIDENTLTFVENETIENNFENKKILFLFLFLLIAGLGGLYYYQLQETIPDILNTIKKCVDETTYLQVKNVIEEILTKPNKKFIGLELLKLMKLIVQPHRVYDVNQFNKCIDKLIKILYSED